MANRQKKTAAEKSAQPEDKMAAELLTSLDGVSEILLKELTKAVSVALNDKLQKLQSSLDELHEKWESHHAALNAMDARVSRQESRMDETADTMADMQRKTRELEDKVDELENRNRRNNMRAVGLPESLQNEALQLWFEKWLPEALGIPGTVRPIVVERAHRLGLSGKADNRPRQAIAKYLNYMDKARILQAYRQKKELLYEGNKVLLFPDYSTRVLAARKEITPYCTQLYNKGIKFALQYPARLHVFHLGDSHLFHTKEEVKRFVEGL